MAGRIRASDIEEVKRRVNIADLVADYVALKPAGIDSLKGLCPFHDERSPSFHVRPSLGYYHCFGCGESGDAISFVRAMDHLPFTEAVERLAAKIGYTLTYEEGGEHRYEGPSRARLYAANQAAASYYQAQLASEEGGVARAELARRGFADEACQMFGVGYAPRGWSGLTDALKAKGFTAEEITLSGLASMGQRGPYDRFRGRIVWPIRDTSGQTVGFGARKLYEDDTGPKYLNTPETPVYHKSQVLYGLDLAKKSISRERRVIVVEGYTDVMACHLAGETSAVATCGTAFGRDHIRVLRRIMGDGAGAEVIFTFDPDEAGQKAALRAFADERMFSAQTYVAVAPDGLDPADLRLHRGDDAVRSMFAQRVPLFEFALKQSIAQFDLDTVEGRVWAMRRAAPIVAEIKDPALRPGYTRELARMLGMDLTEVQQAVRTASRELGSRRSERSSGRPSNLREERDSTRSTLPHRIETVESATSTAAHTQLAEPPQFTLAKLPVTPAVRLERDAIMAMLQYPEAVGADFMAQAVTAEVTTPVLREIRDAIAAELATIGNPDWLERVAHATPEHARVLMRELAVAPLPQRSSDRLGAYVRDVVVALLDRDLLSLKAELLRRLRRIGDPQDPGARRIQEQLSAIEAARRALRNE